MKIETAIKNAYLDLKKNNIKTALLDSEILMSKAIGKDKKFLILNLNQLITKKNFDYFNFLIQERAKSNPIAYLTKKKDFWKYEFRDKYSF